MKMRMIAQALDFGRYMGIAADITVREERHRQAIRFPVGYELDPETASYVVKSLRAFADWIEERISK